MSDAKPLTIQGGSVKQLADADALIVGDGILTPSGSSNSLTLTPDGAGVVIASGKTLTQLGSAQVTFGGNVDAGAGLDISGGDLTIAGSGNNIIFNEAHTGPYIYQDEHAGAGATLIIYAQGSTASDGGVLELHGGASSSGTGGDLLLASGGGGGTDGRVGLLSGSTAVLWMDGDSLYFDTAVATPLITQADETDSGAGESLTVKAQSSTVGAGGHATLQGGDGSSGTGGGVWLKSGSGSTTDGLIYFAPAGNPTAVVDDTSLYFYPSISAPRIYQFSTSSGSGENLGISAQTTSDAGQTGGNLVLASGAGPTAALAGSVVFASGANAIAYINDDSFSFDDSVAAPQIYQASTTAATAENLTIKAQDSSHVTGTGGALVLAGGDGNSTDGSIIFAVGGSGIAYINGTSFSFDDAVSSPSIYQASTSSGAGENFYISAQDTSDAASNGGSLILEGGDGTNNGGNIYLKTGTGSGGSDGDIIISNGGSTAACNILPVVTNTGTLGDSTHVWDECWVNDVAGVGQNCSHVVAAAAANTNGYRLTIWAGWAGPTSTTQTIGGELWLYSGSGSVSGSGIYGSDGGTVRITSGDGDAQATGPSAAGGGNILLTCGSSAAEGTGVSNGAYVTITTGSAAEGGSATAPGNGGDVTFILGDKVNDGNMGRVVFRNAANNNSPDVVPRADDEGYIGLNATRWFRGYFNTVYAHTLVQDDTAFTDTHCPKCGKALALGDSLELYVHKHGADENGVQILRTVPAHTNCGEFNQLEELKQENAKLRLRLEALEQKLGV